MADLQPVTFLVPSSASEPVEVVVKHSGLRMVLVNRDAVGLLDSSWRVLGVYFLLGPSLGGPDRFRAYVGEVGKRTMVTRAKEHVAEKPWWSRALLITSASDDFNSAEIGWLEGRLWDVLHNAVAADVANKGRPGDESLPAHDRAVLERYVEPIMAALRACGFPPDTADQKPIPKGRKRAVYTESVQDLLAAGLLKAGTKLVPIRKWLDEPATVLADGRLEVRGQVYGSVSAAAQAVSGLQSEAGWEFWGAPSGVGSYVPLFDLRARLREGGESTPRPRPSPAAGSAIDASDHPSAPPATQAPPMPRASTSNEQARPRLVPRTKQRVPVTVAEMIADGTLHVGETLTSVRKHPLPTGVLQPDGAVEVAGRAWPSLSSAAQASSGKKAEAGWDFWTVLRDEKAVTLLELRAAFVQRRRQP